MKCQVAETRGSPDGHAEKLRFKDKLTTCSSVQSLSRVWLCQPMNCLSTTNSRSLLKLRSIESVMPSNHLILCRPLFLQGGNFSSKEQASLNFMAAVTIFSDFGAQRNKICHCFYFFPIYLPWSDGTDAMILVFWMLSFKPAFSLSSFTFITRLFSSSSLSAIRVVSSAYLRLLIFLLAVLIPAVLPPAQCFSWCTLHIT